jgi:hypothetical protein
LLHRENKTGSMPMFSVSRCEARLGIYGAWGLREDLGGTR